MMIELAVFGLSIAVLIFRIQNQESEIERLSVLNPDESYGLQKFSRIKRIVSIKEDFVDNTVIFVFVFLNAIILLILFGISSIYDFEKYKDLLSLLFILSLFFTTNTFIQILMSVIKSYIKKQKNLLRKPFIKKEYDEMVELAVCEFEEERINELLKKIDSNEKLSLSQKEQYKQEIINNYISLKKAKDSNSKRDDQKQKK